MRNDKKPYVPASDSERVKEAMGQMLEGWPHQHKDRARFSATGLLSLLWRKLLGKQG